MSLRIIRRKKISSAIFIDLSKAFDTTDHEVLISKLHSYGIKDIEFLFFKNYLSSRRQYSVFNDTIFDWLNILCGVEFTGIHPLPTAE